MKTTYEFRQEVLKALRSGEYKKTNTSLRCPSGNLDDTFLYCPIGLVWELNDQYEKTPFSWFDGLTYTRVAELLGLPDGFKTRIWTWNDIQDLSFVQIADKLEEAFEEYPIPV